VATANGVPQLPGQHPRSGYAQRPQLRGWWRHQQVKDIFLQAVEVDLPGNDSRACGSALEGSELISRPHDNEAMVQPIGMCQPHRRGSACGLGALGRLRHARILTSGRRRCRNINGASIRNAGATIPAVSRRHFLWTPFALRRSHGRAASSLGF
jgi:hypothetical protein